MLKQYCSESLATMCQNLPAQALNSFFLQMNLSANEIMHQLVNYSSIEAVVKKTRHKLTNNI